MLLKRIHLNLLSFFLLKVQVFQLNALISVLLSMMPLKDHHLKQQNKSFKQVQKLMQGIGRKGLHSILLLHMDVLRLLSNFLMLVLILMLKMLMDLLLFIMLQEIIMKISFNSLSIVVVIINYLIMKDSKHKKSLLNHLRAISLISWLIA